MRIIPLSMAALMMSAGLAAAQAPMQSPGAGAEFGAGEGRRMQRMQQEGGADRMERRQQRMDERAQRQDIQIDRADRRPERMDRQEVQVDRAERRERREDRAGRRWDDQGRSGAAVRVERDWDRGERFGRRDRDRYDERVVIRDREPSVRFGFGPGVFVRTLPVTYRSVVVGGRPCRITVTRRVRANGRIVTTERRNCPGRPQVVVRTRR